MENSKYIRVSDVIASPDIFAENRRFTHVSRGMECVIHTNDLDALLFARGRLTDMQLAALTSNLSQHSSIFDGLSDEQKLEAVSSRYNQNFASVDRFREYLVSELGNIEKAELERAAAEAVPDLEVVPKSDGV